MIIHGCDHHQASTDLPSRGCGCETRAAVRKNNHARRMKVKMKQARRLIAVSVVQKELLMVRMYFAGCGHEKERKKAKCYEVAAGQRYQGE